MEGTGLDTRQFIHLRESKILNRNIFLVFPFQQSLYAGSDMRNQVCAYFMSRSLDLRQVSDGRMQLIFPKMKVFTIEIGLSFLRRRFREIL